MKWLVAVDSSKNAVRAFETALSLMNKETDEMFVLCVVEETSSAVMSPYADYAFVLLVDKRLEEDTRKLLKLYAERCKEENIKFSCLLAKGSPKECICFEAEMRKVDVIVMGRRGCGAVERLLVGSNSEYCLRNAPCSVMIIKEEVPSE